MDCDDPIPRSGSINTDDHLLGGRVKLAQPAAGYRVAIDPVLLAAAVAPSPGASVLDAGCGTGAAALCLAARAPNCSVTGVELNAELAALAVANARANGFDNRIAIAEAAFEIYAGDRAGTFDHVITNPPFYAEGRHTRSPEGTRATAHGETGLTLPEWIKAAAIALKPGGRFTMIHRADRLDEVLTACAGRFGAMLIFPLWPRTGIEAKRVIVSAVKGRKTPSRLLPGLTLHEADGAYTEATQAILRDGAALDLTMGCE
jgi:tRNA1(Val) A37 N6-methylase TrmN6